MVLDLICVVFLALVGTRNLCCVWFMYHISELAQVPGDRVQSPKRCVLTNKQDSVLDKDKTMDNVQKHNI
jgi:hypothetical protein